MQWTWRENGMNEVNLFVNGHLFATIKGSGGQWHISDYAGILVKYFLEQRDLTKEFPSKRAAKIGLLEKINSAMLFHQSSIRRLIND